MMIKNFDEVKKQLGELSEVVNQFKSEAVQLRIVELVFTRQNVPQVETPHEEEGQPSPKRAKKKRKAAPSAPATKAENKKPRPPGKGPKAALERFVAEGFFSQKRTIGAVVEHCKLKAQNFKSTDLSGPLGRLVRENVLSRTKNDEGQYEYTKK